jgi:hypothetical protein
MQLRIETASGTTVPAMGLGAVTQRVHVLNSMHGAKPVAMRVRLLHAGPGGAQAVEQAEVSFPLGL